MSAGSLHDEAKKVVRCGMHADRARHSQLHHVSADAYNTNAGAYESLAEQQAAMHDEAAPSEDRDGGAQQSSGLTRHSAGRLVSRASLEQVSRCAVKANVLAESISCWLAAGCTIAQARIHLLALNVEATCTKESGNQVMQSNTLTVGVEKARS